MAEQNRKTAEQKLWRKDAERLVEQYLDYVFCDADGESIAREGRSMMGLYLDFHGDIPKGSGFSGFCTLAAKVDRMRIRHATDWMIRARDIVTQLDGDLINALCVERLYRNRPRAAFDPISEQRYEVCWGDVECAQYLGIAPGTFRNRISQGYQALEVLIKESKKVAA